MTSIKKIGVLGSGVMGSGIAAQVANSGTPAVLLDIVKPGEKNRNALTEGAIEKQLKSNPTGFTHKDKAKLVTCGNLEDDLKLLADCDWIIEVVLEKLEVKQDVYRKIDSVRKPTAVISSNTSTLPLHELTNGLPDAFQQQFMITHFFNPPRFMRLLEVVKGPKTSQAAYDAVCQFSDIHLGKGVVACKDTPGFIGNRIGVYWLMLGLLEAMRLGVSPEQADAAMGKPVGIPKTGVFGLFDLIGIDLMPLIAKSMLHSLPKDDPFVKIYHEPELVKKMIADGYTGRKGKGGFYRLNKDGEKKIKEVIDLKTGNYSPQSKKVELASVEAAKGGMLALLQHKDIGGEYARAVLVPMLHYAASLIPEISDDVASVDAAMKTGYSWKYGPFEMIDKIGVDHFISLLEQSGRSIPPIIAQAKGGALYKTEGSKRSAASVRGYTPITQPAGTLMLSDVKLGSKPVLKNASASLWDLGDGVACLELTSKMNSIDPDILDMMMKSIEAVKKDFKGLVIGGDADNFSVGANLGFVLMAANIAAWKQIGEVIRAGQQSVMALKYAPFPVVSSLSGMALGGGCEIILHSNAVQAHIESYPGLVEVGVGLIPAWGGCKEMLIRHMGSSSPSPASGGGSGRGFIGNLMQGASNLVATGGAMPAISKVFEQIAMAKVSGSADEARDAKILLGSDGITMNRARVLADAKAKCLSMANGYKAPEPAILHLPGGTAKVALSMAVDGFKAAGKATPHDVTVCKMLATVLSGGDTDMSEGLTEQNILDLEFEVFMELLKMKPTLDRIEHMLNTGKPLRN
jgi:3-hydroxyacyl-CoA dehydrogenase